MMRQSFDRPVTVLVGLAMPVDVGTVMEAYALLNDWPQSQRNPTHKIALNACKAALIGLIDAQTARAAFVTFARKNDVLVDDHAASGGQSRTGASQREACHPSPNSVA
jgi:hypothetical protein